MVIGVRPRVTSLLASPRQQGCGWIVIRDGMNIQCRIWKCIGSLSPDSESINYQCSTEGQKRHQNLAPVLVTILVKSLVFSWINVTSAGFYRCCAPMRQHQSQARFGRAQLQAPNSVSSLAITEVWGRTHCQWVAPLFKLIKSQILRAQILTNNIFGCTLESFILYIWHENISCCFSSLEHFILASTVQSRHWDFPTRRGLAVWLTKNLILAWRLHSH